MDSLVQRLSTQHDNEIILEPRISNVQEIQKRISDLGFVFIKFINTNGGTELGIDLDKDSIIQNEPDFLAFEGTAELNFIKVKCHAKVNLKTKQGSAYLEVLN